MKKIEWSKYRKIFLEAMFSHLKRLFSKFPFKMFVIVLLDNNGLENFPLSIRKS